MYLHVGLGNPGKEYELHRHNVGFMAIDSILEKYNIETGKEKFNGYHYIYSGAEQKIIFLKPQTYMNNSGRCVSAIMNFFSIEPSSVIVWHDEIDLDKGKIKVKWGGGHGGHNGLRDIIKALGTNNFYRLRIGIDHPGSKDEVVDYVLRAPNKSELSTLEESMKSAIKIVDLLAIGNFDDAMKALHT